MKKIVRHRIYTTLLNLKLGDLFVYRGKVYQRGGPRLDVAEMINVHRRGITYQMPDMLIVITFKAWSHEAWMTRVRKGICWYNNRGKDEIRHFKCTDDCNEIVGGADKYWEKYYSGNLKGTAASVGDPILNSLQSLNVGGHPLYEFYY